MTEQNEIDIGVKLIEMLDLKLDHEGRIKTTWGTKTALGLYRSIKRILEEVTPQ